MTNKTYPFSMKKYGHNIELAYNHQWLICREMEDGEREFKKEAFDYYEELSEAYAKAIGHAVAWVDSKTYEILSEASAWAEMYRDSKRK